MGQGCPHRTVLSENTLIRLGNTAVAAEQRSREHQQEEEVFFHHFRFLA